MYSCACTQLTSALWELQQYCIVTCPIYIPCNSAALEGREEGRGGRQQWLEIRRRKQGGITTWRSYCAVHGLSVPSFLPSCKQLGCSPKHSTAFTVTRVAFLFVQTLFCTKGTEGASATKLLEAVLCKADDFVVYECKKVKESLWNTTCHPPQDWHIEDFTFMLY